MDLIDDRGLFRTQSLFVEQITRIVRESGYTPLFTLKRKEHKGCPSMRAIYLSYNDPTEYDFAMDTFGSWDHWMHLCESTWFKPFISKWREEMEVRFRSKAVQAILKSATEDGAKGTAAAKYIAEKGWERRAGRPSNIEKAKQAKVEALMTNEIDSDAERMGIH